MFLGREAFDPVCKGLAFLNFGSSDEPYFFRLKRDNFMGKKHTALFQIHNWEMSSFCSTLVRVIAQLYAKT